MNDNKPISEESLAGILNNNGIKVTGITAIEGPCVTLYIIYLDSGIKVDAVRKFFENDAAAFNINNTRVSVLQDSIGVEIPNLSPRLPHLKNLLESGEFERAKRKMELPIAIGIKSDGKSEIVDLAQLPHLLIAGNSGQGQSMAVRCIIESLRASHMPEDMYFVLMDSQKNLLEPYRNTCKTLLALPKEYNSDEEEKANCIANTSGQAAHMLAALEKEMEERYEELKSENCREVKAYRKKFCVKGEGCTYEMNAMPYLVVIINEYADFVKGKSTEAKSIMASILHLAQKGRAVGIHLILTTEKPSADVITGIIKANFPTRLAFKVASQSESKIIIDVPGAESLIGGGDALLQEGYDITRVQVAFIIGEEVDAAVAKAELWPFCLHSYYLPDTKRADLIARIMASKTALESSDLHYLEEAKTIREYIFKSDCCELETRIVSALKNYYSNIPPDISYGNRYLILALAVPRFQLIMKEIPVLTELVENLQPYGEVTVDFGIKEGLGKDVEISIIRSK